MPFVADPLRPMNLPEPALYQLVVQSLPDLAILVFDHDLRYLLAEGDFLKTAGLIPQELIGRTLWEVFPPDAQAQLVPYYQAALEGRTTEFEGRQNQFIYQAQARPLRDHQGQIVAGMMVVRTMTAAKQQEAARQESEEQTLVRDSTERQQMVEELAQERALLRTLIDHLPDLVYIKDQDSRFVMINRIPHDQMTFTREQIIGHTDFDLFPEEMAANFFADEQAIMRTGQVIMNQEESVIAPTGDTLWVSTTKVPLRNSEGTVIGVVGITRDITKQRQVAKALEASEARLRLIMENSHDGIMLANAQGQILLVNPAACRIFGRAEAELLASQSSDLIDETDPRFRHFSDTVRQTGHAQCKLTGFRPDRTTFPLELAGSVFASQNGREQLVSLSIRDLSEHQRYQQALIEQERLQTALAKEAELSLLKSRMMEHIAHEFRTPLTIIQTSAESLETYFERYTAEQRASKFKNIYLQVRHLTGIMEQIGLVMTGDLIPESMHFNPVDLSSLCCQTAQELEKQFGQPGKYRLDLTEPVTLGGDAALLKQAVFHVLQNAAQFSAPAHPVEVSLAVHNQGIDLRVQDTGIGIVPDERGRIFEAFFRGSNIGVVSGLGLGLTIAKAGIELHQGTITVESRLGHGTTVHIWLPLRPA
ncbi:MAG: PAS domain S-box protein [Chloroflexi bacterium]|nr:PAS domain S-box protein [Chloroflexota bacterium]